MSEQHPSTWSIYAGAWDGQQMPLRPQAVDISNYHQAVTSLPIGTHPIATVLGVTPELHRLLTQLRFDVHAVDSSEKMIKTVWPGDSSKAHHANWTDIDQLPFRSNVFVCDGGLHLLSFHDQEQLASKFGKMLANQNRIVFRLFLPPEKDQQMTSQEIINRLEAGEIHNLSYLKVNLWHAADLNHEGTVGLAEIWNTLAARARGDINAYFSELGFASSEIDTLLPYRDSTTSYYFRPLAAIDAMFSAFGGLSRTAAHYPDYPMGRQFPVVTFEK